MTALAIIEQNVVSFNEEQMALLKNTIAKDATDSELALFVNQCKRTGLDPFTKQIYFIKDKKGNVTICTAIDGLRLVAERTGKYEGQTEPQWCGDDGVWKDVWLSDELPKAARQGVWKTGFKTPVYGVALFREYAGIYSFDDNYGKFKKGDLTHMWNKMPVLMISKVAEALALRKAFPNDLSSLYSTDEISELVENAAIRDANMPKPVKEILSTEKDPYFFEGGKYQGKKFHEVSHGDFSAELARYKAVPNITANLQSLIDRMERFIQESITSEIK
jgi:phage recombination protein Bet